MDDNEKLVLDDKNENDELLEELEEVLEENFVIKLIRGKNE